MLQSARQFSRNRIHLISKGYATSKIPMRSNISAAQLSLIEEAILQAKEVSMEVDQFLDKVKQQRGAPGAQNQQLQQQIDRALLHHGDDSNALYHRDDTLASMRPPSVPHPNTFGEHFNTAAANADEVDVLTKRQLKIEEEQLHEASIQYQDTLKELTKMGRGTTMKAAQRLVLQWYEPLIAALKLECDNILKSKKFSRGNEVYLLF